MKVRMTWRLSAMMALIYSVQGAFWPLLAIHLADLGIGGRDRGWIFGTVAIASTAVPMGFGQLVDRLMPTQRVLALILGLGTVLLAPLAAGWVDSALGIFAVFLAYWMAMAPVYGLANALAMRHLDDPGRDFGRVRSWGTAGWMASGWVVSLVLAALGPTRTGHGAYPALGVAAVFSAITSIYCLTLPHTPPLAIGPKAPGFREAWLELLRPVGVVPVLITSLGFYLTQPMVYQIIPAYFEAAGLPRAWVTSAMTLGQMSEIAILVALPWILKRFGIKATLAIGIVAWLARFLILSLGPPLWIAVAATLLHGAGIACFAVAAQVFLDVRAPGHLRGSAQALSLVATSGLGSLLGNLLAGEVASRSHPRDVLVFLFPCIILGALLLYFLRGFRVPASGVPWAGATSDESVSRSPSGRGPVARAGHLVTESADG